MLAFQPHQFMALHDRAVEAAIGKFTVFLEQKYPDIPPESVST